MNFIDYINLTLNGFYMSLAGVFFIYLLFVSVVNKNIKTAIISIFAVFVLMRVFIYQDETILDGEDIKRIISSGYLKSDVLLYLDENYDGGLITYSTLIKARNAVGKNKQSENQKLEKSKLAIDEIRSVLKKTTK